MSILSKIFGTKYDRDIKKMSPVVDEINAVYETLRDLPEEEFLARTDRFREELRADREEFLRKQLPEYISPEDVEERLAEYLSVPIPLWEDMMERHLPRTMTPEERRIKAEQFGKDAWERREEKLGDLLPEAFATVKEGARRLLGQTWDVSDHATTWDMVHFDVQLIGGIALHQGRIAEMATGEGKTLVATLPLYLNALAGDGCHLITVNDYLARRDAEWVGHLLEYLGVSVGCIQSGMYPKDRREQYNKDVTYGTNSEFGFDYLRDNGVALRAEEQVQRGHAYAIIDEVDSVLIDEARTPLIISGPSRKDFAHNYNEFKPLVERLVRKQIALSAELMDDAEGLLEEGEDGEAYYNLLKVAKSTPKNRRLLKLYEDPRLKKEVQRLEMEIMRDKKMHEVAEELYFSLDEKGHAVELSDMGREFLSPSDPGLFEVPDIETSLSEIEGDEESSEEEKEKLREQLRVEYEAKNEKLHNISQLLRAYLLFERDVEYVVKDNRVVIVDQFTGRLMPSRRYSDGLHQALEAKEGVDIERETMTLATITIQNYFRMYKKRGGMTGTAETEAQEFFDIYKLDVMVIPTNEPIRRVDSQDVIFRTKREKYNAIIDEIVRMHECGRPVLVGTVTVDVSETISRLLKRRNIPHNVLNAKQHQREAEIVRDAGQVSAVTIATNMAGRGTDIKLAAEVLQCRNCALINGPGDYQPDHPDWADTCRKDVPCGLHIVGTERHEARRIDRQLRGRSGRQGDPGSTRFFLSLEDDLMRLFGSDRIAGILTRMGLEEGEPIEAAMITKNIERAQRRVEEQNFTIRKRVLEYDDVMNRQRQIIYQLRNQILHNDNLRDDIFELIRIQLEDEVADCTPVEMTAEQWDIPRIVSWVRSRFPAEITVGQLEDLGDADAIVDVIMEAVTEAYDRREEAYGPDLLRQIERFVMLTTLDENWQDHLTEMNELREGITLRSYGQLDPLVEYKREAYNMFEELLGRVDEETVSKIFRVHVGREGRTPQPAEVRTVHPELEALSSRARKPREAYANSPEEQQHRTVVRQNPKVGRNDPCPCGSGKKYKKCCGAGE
ncbi:MAG: preprotein translocase subunit SecA [Candidatus Zixiibacteriota bacterium]|jgi:preprotein translocase subunit SecA